jgi:DNA invertase Pin-like site-specific DNA recombinase
MLIGYARVSTGDQNLDLQKNALVRAECEQIFEDTASGKNARRPGLKRAIRRLNLVIAGGLEAGSPWAQRS